MIPQPGPDNPLILFKIIEAFNQRQKNKYDPSAWPRPSTSSQPPTWNRGKVFWLLRGPQSGIGGLFRLAYYSSFSPQLCICGLYLCKKETFSIQVVSLLFSIVSLLQTVLQLNQNTLILMCFDISMYVITTKGGLLQRVREETALCLETLCSCPVLCGHHLVIVMITR